MLELVVLLAVGFSAIVFVGSPDDSDGEGLESRDTSEDQDQSIPLGEFLELLDDNSLVESSLPDDTSFTYSGVPADTSVVTDDALNEQSPSEFGSPEVLSDQVEHGDQTNDLVLGGSGNDYLIGGGGNDEMRGGDGDDVLIGTDDYEMTEGDFPFYQLEDDTLCGGDGDDTIIAHSGTAEGGAGGDTFVATGLGVLTVTDFSEDDVLVIMRNTSDFDLAGGQSATPDIDVRTSEDGTQTEVFVDGECAAILDGVGILAADQISVILSDDLQAEIWS